MNSAPRLIPILLLCLPLLGGCGIRESADTQFGDQYFKTAIALVELHRIRTGAYPETLNELHFLGYLDAEALTGVEYKKVDSGYEINIVRGWISAPELSYPEEFWKGLGVVKTNVKRGS